MIVNGFATMKALVGRRLGGSVRDRPRPGQPALSAPIGPGS